MSQPFLSQVAEVYSRNEASSLSEYCFVFPNKRSATFFSMEIEKRLQPPYLMPAIAPVSQFVSDLSDLTEASRFQQLTTLYSIYRKLGAEGLSFDDFIFWGDMILNDFNDVDRWLIDARELFTNVKNEREISSTYLSEQQIEVIESYWGDEINRGAIDEFWTHVKSNGEKPVHSNFLKLWEILYPLYIGFREALEDKGLATTGMFYRNAVEAVAAYSDYPLHYRRYIFVGFNVLSTAEMKIFSRLQSRSMADFYWDFASPAFTDEQGNRAGKYVEMNRREFPSRYPLDDSPVPFPSIKLIGVPSQIGQAKIAGQIIEGWLSDNTISDPSNAVDTAVVLPDENLFIPMIHSIPEEISGLNVTMGFPIKLTPVAALIRLIVRLQLRASKTREGSPSFFYEDVINLLSMPLLSAIFPEECLSLISVVRNSRLFRIPLDLIRENASVLLPVFAPAETFESGASTRSYIKTLLAFLDKGIPETDALQKKFIKGYGEVLDSLCDATTSSAIEMKGTTLLRMIERSMATSSVNFSGEPLQGLQIMGMLETRALDFKNLIILSLNERVFPKRYQRRSFIPDSLRTAYHLDNADFQESVFSYYFYRVISRAENVALLYDSRTVGGLKSNEMSRFAKQLLFLYPDAVTEHTSGVFHGLTSQAPPVSIPKNERILEILERYKPGGDRNLSPSSINTYISCPLNFYFSFVEGMNPDNETVDYMDAGTFGDVLHTTLEAFYPSLPRTDGKILVTPEILESYLRPDKRIDAIIEEKIRECYPQETKDGVPLSGETLVMAKVIRKYIDTLLRLEKDNGTFEYKKGELPLKGSLKINDDLSVNISLKIDRIDKKDGVMRFIDYKTGSDTTDAPSVESIFDRMNPYRNKAIQQLMFYCNFWHAHRNDDSPIKPMIYSMKHLAKDGIQPITVGDMEVRDYHQLNEEYLPRLHQVISEIFNPEVPFTQSESPHSCTFCNFKSVCDRK